MFAARFFTKIRKQQTETEGVVEEAGKLHSKPFQFTKKLLWDKQSGRLSCPQQEVEDHLRNTHSSPNREEGLGDPDTLLNPEPLSTGFDDAEHRLQEIKEIIRKARAGSAPGPKESHTRSARTARNCCRCYGNSSKWYGEEDIYQMVCLGQKVASFRKKRFLRLWSSSGQCLFWTLRERCFCQSLQGDLRPIWWPTSTYMDTSVQKGGVLWVSWCLEHISVLTQLTKEANAQKGDLTVLWLDLSNAYGTVAYKLVDLTLRKYHVPEKFQILLEHYFYKYFFSRCAFIVRLNNVMATHRGRDSHWMYYFGDSLFCSDKPYCQDSGEDKPRSSTYIRDTSATYKSFHGRHDNNSKVSAGLTVDVTRSRTTDLLVKDEVQADKVKKFGPEEREIKRPLLLQDRRWTYPDSDRASSEEPRQVVQELTQRQGEHSGDAETMWRLDNSDIQEWNTREIQGCCCQVWQSNSFFLNWHYHRKRHMRGKKQITSRW